MSISSSLNAGVAGLAANSTRLATIADNIANSSTYGYKRMEAQFNSMVLDSGRGATTYSAGGVRATTSRAIEQKGTLISTNHPLDIALTGRGMLPVLSKRTEAHTTGDLPLTLTTTGAFRPDKDGVLRTESGLILLGWPANPDGSIPLASRDTVGQLQPVVISPNQSVADPTTQISLGINLPATATDANAHGDPIPFSVEYFGNLGTPETLLIDFVPSLGHSDGKSNEWTMQIRDSATPGGAVIGEYTITFSDSMAAGGRIETVTAVSGDDYDPDTGTIPLTVGGGTIALNIGEVGGIGGLTQVGAIMHQSIIKNGSPAGNLTGIEIDERGMIRATYDTGFVRTLYQVPLVDVPNPNGLTALNNQTYEVSPSSGAFFLWNAGDGPTGKILGYTREGSTTDVAAELTNLIQTQRAYSSNAKVIQTVDEMLQETTNIKR